MLSCGQKGRACRDCLDVILVLVLCILLAVVSSFCLSKPKIHLQCSDKAVGQVLAASVTTCYHTPPAAHLPHRMSP